MTTALSEFCANAIAANGWTNDAPRLETRNEWYVFRYTKRKGVLFDSSNKHGKFISIGWTKSKIYSILNIHKGASEWHLATPAGTDSILGEVWRLPTSQMYTLDCEENNTVTTRRILVPIEIGSQTLLAWMYLADNAYLLRGGIHVMKVTSSTYIGNNKYLEVA